MAAPVFVVGTGRCGSTMLSNMIRQHPKILSISEFFTMVVDGGNYMEKPFTKAPVTGKEFWEIVTHPAGIFYLQFGLPFPECLYPYDKPGARFTAKTGVPGILVATLPHLADDYEALYETLSKEIGAWPKAPIKDHYARLFESLKVRFGKEMWIERSGMIFGVFEPIFAMFPDAKIIHLVRDGRDTALSINDHAPFRFWVVMRRLAEYLGVDPFTSTDRTRIDRVPQELRRFLPEAFDREAMLTYRNPLAPCGQFWSDQIVAGMKVLEAVPPKRVLTLRYEGFMNAPRQELEAFAAFLGDEYRDEAWVARCAASVKPPRQTWRDLPKDVLRSLNEACKPGFEALRAAGVDYEM